MSAGPLFEQRLAFILHALWILKLHQIHIKGHIQVY